MRELPENLDVIAHAVYEVEGRSEDAELKFYKPYEEDGTYYCVAEITGLPGVNKKMPFAGVDSMQALFLSIQGAACNIFTSDDYKAGRLRYYGREHLPIPLIDSIRKTLFED